jgi:hypothetical protein
MNPSRMTQGRANAAAKTETVRLLIAEQGPKTSEWWSEVVTVTGRAELLDSSDQQHRSSTQSPGVVLLLYRILCFSFACWVRQEMRTVENTCDILCPSCPFVVR